MSPASCRFFILLAAILTTSGCTTYRDPSIDVTGVRLAQLTDEAAALSFSLDLHNPNNDPLTLLYFDYHLSVDGKDVYSGKRAAETVLAALGSKQVTIPAVIPFEAARWPVSGEPDQSPVLPATAKYS